MKYKTEYIMMRVEPELKERAQKRAEEQHDSLSRYIIKLILQDLENAEK